MRTPQDKAYAVVKSREWRAKYPERARNTEFKSRYGITLLDWEQLFAGQDGLCAICLIEMVREGRKTNSAQVDHDHTTGKIRGLLCLTCNILLGAARDSETILLSARDYLILRR